jgi:hypothetical protein
MARRFDDRIRRLSERWAAEPDDPVDVAEERVGLVVEVATIVADRVELLARGHPADPNAGPFRTRHPVAAERRRSERELWISADLSEPERAFFEQLYRRYYPPGNGSIFTFAAVAIDLVDRLAAPIDAATGATQAVFLGVSRALGEDGSPWG